MEKKHMTYEINATGGSLGRVASEAAKALMGKTDASYTPHILSDVKVTISHASKIQMPEKKRMAKTYTHYTGYPGGLRKATFSTLTARKGVGEAIRLAVKRMLPRNTMLVARMKNLIITE